MDGVKIKLDCEEWTSYSNIKYKSGKIVCPECKNHEIDINFCLDMLVNREIIKRKLVELSFDDMIEVNYSEEIDAQFDGIINKIDLECENVFKEINDYRDSILKELKVKRTELINQMEKLNLKIVSKDNFETEINKEKKIPKKILIEKKYETMIADFKSSRDQLEKKMKQNKFDFKVPHNRSELVRELIGKMDLVFKTRKEETSFRRNLQKKKSKEQAINKDSQGNESTEQLKTHSCDKTMLSAIRSTQGSTSAYISKRQRLLCQCGHHLTSVKHLTFKKSPFALKSWNSSIFHSKFADIQDGLTMIQLLENPAGYRFEVANFTHAHVHMIKETKSSTGTWFPDYNWTTCLCPQCSIYVGWFLQSNFDLDFFFCLKVENLVVDPSGEELANQLKSKNNH